MDANSAVYIWTTFLCSLVQGVASAIAIYAAIVVFKNRLTITSAIGLFRLYSWRREIEKELYRLEKKLEKTTPTSSGPGISDLKNELDLLNSMLRSMKDIVGSEFKEEFALIADAKNSSSLWQIVGSIRAVITTIRYGQFLGKQ